jgi:GDP-L-fucose synthase|tara:strand:- start:436 stop:1407 length:972 start_codon:yes stop_codon:yes gene_type:complete
VIFLSDLKSIKKILLTGGSGMVGKSILNHSEINKWELIAPRRNELNLNDYQSIEKLIKKFNPDLIIHSAGHCGGIHTSISEPVEFLVNNIEIGKNIIIAAKNLNIKRFINLASSCMYPRNAKSPLTENLILKGELEPTNEGYALAKIFTTKLCQYINREKPNFKYKTLIPCNLYGPNDKFDPQRSHAIASIIHKIYNVKKNHEKEISIWGDGLARREFMYVGDLADFIVQCIKRFEELPEIINAGLGEDYSINEYYEIIAKELNWKGKFSYDLSKPVGMKQKMVCTKLLDKFGWKHRTSLQKGIKLTVEFYNDMVNKNGKILR